MLPNFFFQNFKGHYERDNSTRKELFESWCQLSNWYRNQPLDKVQEYLGTKEAFYFAWLGFYMRFLIPASICGVLVLLYGLCTLSGDRVRWVFWNFKANILLVVWIDFEFFLAKMFAIVETWPCVLLAITRAIIIHFLRIAYTRRLPICSITRLP